MNNPKISVIVVYKDKNNLEKCLQIIRNQTFSNIEIICVNNASKDNSEEIVKSAAKEDVRIKLISLPFENDDLFAKKAGLGVASGEFTCFIDPNDEITTNFLTEKYIATTIKQNIEIENKHLYRRNFLENDEEITRLIDDRINQELEKYSSQISEKKNEIKQEFDKFYQINEENIKNSSYEILCRFNQLEQFVYAQENLYKNRMAETIQKCGEKSMEAVHQIYEDISKVYDYINSENNKKGCELNKIYEEITKNYNYTEELAAKIKSEIINLHNAQKQELDKRLTALEKEIIVRYVNLKRITDMQTDDINIKLSSVCGKSNENTSDCIEKAISENVEKMYEQINKNGQEFYTELTNIYKEFNEKIIKQKEIQSYELEKRIGALKEEINSKIEKLK